jgi:hypothetical protein
MKLSDLIDKYEIPEEYIAAMFEAYELGARRFMEIQMGIELPQQLVSGFMGKFDVQENAKEQHGKI